jgi:hypothetical protein
VTNGTRLASGAAVNPREDFHRFVDGLEDKIIKPALHLLVDNLSVELVPAALRRMRALHARITVEPPQLTGDRMRPSGKTAPPWKGRT